MTQRRNIRVYIGDGHIELVKGGVSRCGNAATQLLSTVREIVISCSSFRHGCSYNNCDHIARARTALNLCTDHHRDHRGGDFMNENAAVGIKSAAAAPGRFDCSSNIEADDQEGPADITLRAPSSHHHLILQRSQRFFSHYNHQSIKFLRRSIRHVWKKRPPLFMLPIPHKHGDCNMIETVINVITSLPFIYIGFQAPRKTMVTKVYANSLIGVGVASSLYHTSRGDARKIFRWGDYAMISTSALVLRAS